MSFPPAWKISIDVGGTFTDAVATDPKGAQHTLKVLSSGITKGRIGKLHNAGSFEDPARVGDGKDFWKGYSISFFDDDGLVLSSEVSAFQSSSGRVQFANENESITGGMRYEITPPFSAAVLAIRKLLSLSLDQPIPDVDLRLGTTKGTNALLTRTGCPTGLIITKGFADLLEIGEQNRPNLFELSVKKYSQLYKSVAEINERVRSDGTVEQVPVEQDIRDQLTGLRSNGIRSLAICLMHGYAFPQHEELVASIAREIGFDEIRCSSQVAPLIKIVPRGETTVLDAYLNPVLQEYLSDLSSTLSENSRLRLMTSAGGLVPVHGFSGRDSILSGPAGGVVGFAHVAKELGYEKSIGLDMGGTSTDVARFDGAYEKEFETFKAGVRIVSPTIAIETVAAGGGSICRYDGIRLLVGPESAGADPGPACYGRGGPLTVTDLNVFLGRLVQAQFPFPLDYAAVDIRLTELLASLSESERSTFDKYQLCRGLLQVANANMAAAIRTVSVASGYDPREYAMVAFGGAACQHACQIADQLDIRTIISHPLGGILSAVGISKALPTSQSVSPIAVDNQDDDAALQSIFQSLESKTISELVDQGFDSKQVRCQRSVDIKYLGTQSPINVEGNTLSECKIGFLRRHQEEFGYGMDRDVEILAARVEGSVSNQAHSQTTRESKNTVPVPVRTQKCVFEAEIQTPVFDREKLVPGDQIIGPAIVYDALSCTVIDPGWSADLVQGQSLIIERIDGSADAHADRERRIGELPDRPDPVQLEVFNNYFTSIAQQMGEMLRRTAVSVNVKERLDYSCAIFTADGNLVVNAPHIPVHLGAMGETVKATIELNPNMAQGDVFVTNDPYRGGSHLPDVTVVSPVFDDSSGERIFFVATRCHHAEIGGVAAGSMSPDAITLEQEGVLISNFKLISADVEFYDRLSELLSSGPYPSRNVPENISDITAQVAANRRGIIDLRELTEKYSLRYVLKYMEFIQDAAEEKTRAALAEIPDGCSSFCDKMDCGAKISVHLDKRGSELIVDFQGTSATLPLNLNANKAIVTAALLYCVRCLIDEDIPLNQGILNPIELIVPDDCFINPRQRDPSSKSPAVAGGNVETSQRIVDVILGAWELAAASQGTMNNFLCGNQNFSYYETICGGTGATKTFTGASAVHSHMTNTRLTDPEVLESQFPMVLRRFSIRKGSGGKGQLVGGDGVVREIEFLSPAQVTLMTNRRTESPYGMKGGKPGTKGLNRLVRHGGEMITLDSQCQIDVNKNDRIILETPGGGGWGQAES